MKYECCLWDGWLDRADDEVEVVRKRHSSDAFTVDYKSVMYKTKMKENMKRHEEGNENVAKSNEKLTGNEKDMKRYETSATDEYESEMKSYEKSAGDESESETKSYEKSAADKLESETEHEMKRNEKSLGD